LELAANENDLMSYAAGSASSKDPRVVRTHTALSDAFLKLLETKTLEQISIRDIVTEASVGYTTFFRHHASKEALLNVVAARQIQCLFNLAVPVIDAYDVDAGSTAIFTYVNAHRPLWATLLTGGAAGTIRAEFLGMARKVATLQGRPDGLLPAEAGVILVIGGTLDLLAWWLGQTTPTPINQMADILKAVVVNPVIAAGNSVAPRKRK